jgi:hypothetical protein
MKHLISIAILLFGLWLASYFSPSEVMYELAYQPIQTTKVVFDKYTLKVIEGKTKRYEYLCEYTSLEGKKWKTRLYQQSPRKDHEILVDSLIRFGAKHILVGDAQKYWEQIKPLRDTQKGDTLLLSHAGRPYMPYKIENLTQKTTLKTTQGEERLSPNIAILAFASIFIGIALWRTFKRNNKKPTTNNQHLTTNI